jgi:hypothetical protein
MQSTGKDIKSEVTELLKSADYAIIKQFFWSEIKDYLSDKDKDGAMELSEVIETSRITFEHCDNYGGEGQGDEYWSVYKFSNKSRGEFCHIKFDGYYTSYGGSEYDDWFFVEPKQVTVTQYVKVKG